jgi:hypothetical protein
MNYEEKYLKYKYKYAILKNNNKTRVMHGGSSDLKTISTAQFTEPLKPETEIQLTDEDINSMAPLTELSPTKFKPGWEDYFYRCSSTGNYIKKITTDNISQVMPRTHISKCIYDALKDIKRYFVLDVDKGNIIKILTENEIMSLSPLTIISIDEFILLPLRTNMESNTYEQLQKKLQKLFKIYRYYNYEDKIRITPSKYEYLKTNKKSNMYKYEKYKKSEYIKILTLDEVDKMPFKTEIVIEALPDDLQYKFIKINGSKNSYVYKKFIQGEFDKLQPLAIISKKEHEDLEDEYKQKFKPTESGTGFIKILTLDEFNKLPTRFTISEEQYKSLEPNFKKKFISFKQDRYIKKILSHDGRQYIICESISIEEYALLIDDLKDTYEQIKESRYIKILTPEEVRTLPSETIITKNEYYALPLKWRFFSGAKFKLLKDTNTYQKI